MQRNNAEPATAQTKPVAPKIWYAPYLAGATGAVIETVTLHGFDTAAKRLQKNKGKLFSWHGVMSFGSMSGISQSWQVLQSNGRSNVAALNQVIFREQASASLAKRWVSLYPGVGVGAGYKVIQRAYKLGCQSKLQAYLESQHQFADHFGKYKKDWLAGISGAMVGAGEVFLLPLDILKVKMQTRGATDQPKSFLTVWRQENPYKGISVTVPRNMIGSFSFFGVRQVMKSNGVDKDIANAAGTVVSIVVPAPFDVIKTRMQAGSVPMRARDAFRMTFKEEGFSALFKGAIAKVMTQGPKVFVCFAVAERVEHAIPGWVQSVKEALQRWRDKQSSETARLNHSLLFFQRARTVDPAVEKTPVQKADKWGPGPR
ncbi:MAG: MC/SLC25 family protein [Gammaproteobacteria bacterium]|nr:MC/SLC25 family protein [Gammaproteobacteria bacterium]